MADDVWPIRGLICIGGSSSRERSPAGPLVLSGAKIFAPLRREGFDVPRAVLVDIVGDPRLFRLTARISSGVGMSTPTLRRRRWRWSVWLLPAAAGPQTVLLTDGDQIVSPKAKLDHATSGHSCRAGA
jgi:hypothetical protein